MILSINALLRSVWFKSAQLKLAWAGLLLMLVLPAFSVQATTKELFHYAHTNVLGTSFELKIQAPNNQADQVEQSLLAEIKRLETLFSTYDPESEISLLNQTGSSQALSAEMFEVIEACESWKQQLPMAFSCRLGRVIKLWQDLEGKDTRPDRIQIREVARQAHTSSYSLDDLKAGKSNQDFEWNLGAIAKGYILDQAMKLARQQAPDAQAISLDIGGDGLYWRKPNETEVSTASQNWLVGLAVPGQVDDSQQQRLGTLAIRQGAIAYSGHGSRGRQIGRRVYSHILTPRDGWPKEQPLTAIVRAESALEADVLATALATSEISDALDWLSKKPQYAALLIDQAGRQFASKNWYDSYMTDGNTVKSNQIKIRFSLPKLEVAEYRKPFVSIWVEDSNRKPVKNLLLLGQNERWMQENRHWWRIQGRTTPELLEGFARPTRRPGEYQLTWDGRDDFGRLLAEGQYSLYVEASREHGDHERLGLKFELNGTAQQVTKEGKKELTQVEIKVLEPSKLDE